MSICILQPLNSHHVDGRDLVFLSPVNYSSKFIELEEGLREPWVCSWLVRSTGDKLDL